MALPLSKTQALKAISWMKDNFITDMKAAIKNTPFSIDTLCGIACQETAFVWVNWINRKSVEEILQLSVFDASGDFPGTQRSAFPRNTQAFRNFYDEEFAGLLIDEANKSRKARNLPPRDWVYKGYGLYQYDLQHVKVDEGFFRDKEWYSYKMCLEKVMLELNRKWAIHHDMFKTIRAYNGSGSRAQEYANNVIVFIEYSKEVV